ncbi:MAG TPA: DUF6600 domain-containing protein [Steroidobacteraceae bacterium]|nr:DUF6600 domain-containing protein [Steroidobacteraceae bacterium]
MRMRLQAVFGAIATGTLLSLGALGAALAQDQPQGDDTQMIEQLGEDSDQASSPPGRAAQLSDAEGSVSLEPAGTSSWTSAAVNRPLTLGDKVWTDQNSRAELDIGDAVIRLGSTTGFSFLNLDEQTAQMQVTAGTVIVHVRSLANGEQDEIDTPNLALTLQQAGTYRVEVSDSGDTTIVKVDDGEALATGGGQSYPLTAQQSITFTGTSTLSADYASIGAPDSLDDWSMQRDQQQQQQAAAEQDYVPPDTVGADDLGSYGGWESTPDWGYAWFPSVAVGWAPYTIGYWAWVSPWGWTWVDQEPWGFAPFHYGRWGYWHRRWCWIPGPRGARPVYAPALVGWVGGRRAGVAVSAGARVGWFPLGPRDVYVPGYRTSPAYVRNVNLANARLLNTTQIGNAYKGRVTNARYANSEVPGAVTAVPRNVFTSAQPIAPHRVRLSQQDMAGMQATSAAPPIVPGRESVLGANAGRVVKAPPRALADRPVVARLAPPRAPVSFTREQAAIRANGGRPLPVTQLSQMRPNTPAVPVRLARPQVSRGAPAGPSMSARESALQHQALPPASAPRNDRPPWVDGRAAQPEAPAGRSYPQAVAPQQRQPPQEWHAPPQRQPAPERAPPPVQRFTAPPQPPERQVPEQRFTPPERQVPEQRFTPPERQVPEQHFTSPERQAPEQHFTPPERQAPEQRFTPPSYERAPMREESAPPRAAPDRAPERAPERRPSPPRSQADRH